MIEKLGSTLQHSTRLLSVLTVPMRALSDWLKAAPVDVAVIAGTSSVRVVRHHGPASVLPAFVARDVSTRRVLASGDEAHRMEGKTPPQVAVVRPFQDRIPLDLDAAVHLLSQALRSSTHTWLRRPRVAATVHAASCPLERRALRTALRAAGAGKLTLIDEAMALAVGARLPLTRPQGGMVINIGASATELAITALGGLACARTLGQGGDRMDQTIRDYVRHKHDVLIGAATAEEVKRNLGCALPLISTRYMEVGGRHQQSGRPTKVRLSSTEICEALQEPLQTLTREINRVLATVSAELLADVAQSGMILAGGGASLQRLDEYLSAKTALPVRVAPQPQEVAMAGAQQMLRNRKLLKLAELPDTPALRTRSSHRPAMLALLLLCISLLWTLQSAPAVRAGTLAEGLQRTMGSADRMLAAPIAWSYQSDEMPALSSELGRKNQRLAELEFQNQQMQTLLGLRARAPAHPVAANVLLRDATGWLATLTLDAGAGDRVVPRAAVASGDGLVGQVVSVSPLTSRVRLITASNAVVAARVRGRSAAGVVYGSGRNYCELRYLDPDAPLRVGDQVVTNGQDGIYPSGLLIGSVDLIYPSRDLAYKSARVQPAAHLATLGPVLVMVP